MSLNTTALDYGMIACPHCGGFHAGRCPWVKAVEYHPDGSVKRVEYFEGWFGAPNQLQSPITTSVVRWISPNTCNSACVSQGMSENGIG